jgi:hypothetical protein
MRSNSQVHSLNSSGHASTSKWLISGISVVFDFGLQDRGQSAGQFSQADAVDGYGYRLSEELEYENVRLHPVDTRRAPFRTEAQRLEEVPANFIPVFLSTDWHARERQVNSSSVEFCGHDLYKLADALCFAMAEWGRAYVFGHRVLRPVAVEGARPFIRVKPFAINGPHAQEYMKRLDKLGEDLGRAIGGYLSERGEGLRR